MKKIVATTVAASLIAGAAFADVKISNNFRIRPVIAEWNMGTEADTSSRYFNLLGQSAADTLTFESKTDYAGVKFAFSDNAATKAVSVDSYSGWLKFGALKFTGIMDASRFMGRCTADQNNLSILEQNWGATYNTAKKGTDKDGKVAYYNNKTTNKVLGNKKLGINANSGASVGIDSDNISAQNGTNTLSFITEYTFKDIGGGDLTLVAVLLSKAGDRITFSGVYGSEKITTTAAIDATVAYPYAYDNSSAKVETTYDVAEIETAVDSTYAFRAAYKAKAFSADANLHLLKDKMAVSAFVAPKVEGLDSVFGFTFASDKSDSSYDKAWWALDARARFAASEQLSVTGMINYTNCDPQKVKDAGKKGGILDAVVNTTFKMNDTVKLFGELEYVGDFRDYKSKADIGDTLVVQAGTILTAGKGAELDLAARCTLAGIDNDLAKDTYGTQIQLPVCMRIKL